MCVVGMWKVKLWVVQSCPTICHPTDYSLPGSSLHGILKERIMEWVAIAFSRGSSWPRVWIWVFCISGRFFTFWATMEVLWMNNVPQISMSPRPQNVTLFENKIFADVIKVTVKMSLKWTQNVMSVLVRYRKRYTETHREGGCVNSTSLSFLLNHTQFFKKNNSFLELLVHNCFLDVCKPALYMAVVPQKLCSILLADAPAEHRLFLTLILSVVSPTVSPS